MGPGADYAAKLLAPPQQGARGPAAGKTTLTANTQTAGQFFNPIVRVVDVYFNKTASTPPGGTLHGTDPHDNRPAEYQADPLALTFVNGTVMSTWTFTTATGSGWNLSANVPGYTSATDSSPNILVVAGPPQTLQIVLPGETAVPRLSTYNLVGTSRTGSSTAWMTGVSSKVVVNVVDKHFNIATTAGETVSLSNNTDAFVGSQTQSLVSGT